MTAASENIFVMPARLVKGELNYVREQLAGRIASGSPFEIDLACVIDTDGVGVQMILSTAKTARDNGVAVTLRNRTPGFDSAIDRCHAGSLLNDWTR